MTPRRILVAGMPSSGKSTYIAAMRHVLLSDETESKLVMSRLADDERHLNALQDHWLALNTFDRTREKSEGWVNMHVRDRATGAEAQLVVPDLRGEVFEWPAATGTCLRTVADALAEAQGMLLFTNAEKADDSLLISDFGDIVDGGELANLGGANSDELASAGAPSPIGGSSIENKSPTAEGDAVKGRLRFQPNRMPEEAKIIELLQFANRRPSLRRRRRLAVIISAWDAVLDGDDKRNPTQWLEQQRPMLAQFLKFNADAWDVRVYGASAQGGTLPRDKERLQALETASERIIMVGHDSPSHDPTAPIAWLISGA